MDEAGVGATVLTSTHNIAYYSGFLYCSSGRACTCAVTGAGAENITGFPYGPEHNIVAA